MLSAASRLRAEHYSAFYPALLLIQELEELGHPGGWDEVRSPALDAEFLFVPDFQLDCGSWGELSAFQRSALFRLLEYRRNLGLITIVGIQNPHKLMPYHRKVLLGEFDALHDLPAPAPLELPSADPLDRSFRPLAPGQESLGSLASYEGGSLLIS